MFASIFYETCYMYVVHCDAPINSRNSVFFLPPTEPPFATRADLALIASNMGTGNVRCSISMILQKNRRKIEKCEQSSQQPDEKHERVDDGRTEHGAREGSACSPLPITPSIPAFLNNQLNYPPKSDRG